MLIQNIALVPEAGGVTPAELLRVSAALQKQVSSHFGPCWGLEASVDPFLELEQVPAGYIPIVLRAPENSARSLDVSLDSNGQPYARVSLTAGWSLAASRACLELLLNPFGQRTVNASSPRSDQGPAEILVEACGAFGEMPTAYAVNDVAVSDFCTPAFFRAQSARGVELFSFRGSLSAPLTLLRGGHLAWFDAISNSWWLRSFHDENPSDRSLGPLKSRSRALRELILRHEPHGTGSALSLEPLDARIRWQWLREQASAASVARAQRLRASLGVPLAVQRYEEEDEEDTLAMALRAPQIEPDRARRSSPPPLPSSDARVHGEQLLEAGSLGTSLERERANVMVTKHELRSASVIVETRDPPVVQAALERRDTLPLTQLLPPPAPTDSSVAAVPAAQTNLPLPTASEPGTSAPQMSAQPNVPTFAPEPSSAPERPGVSATVSHSSISPIAMLAEPPRNEASRTGFMIAGAGAAALLTVAIMSRGTRSEAHTQQAPEKPAAAAAAEPEAAKEAPASATVPAPHAVAPSVPSLPSAPKAERPRPAEPTTSAAGSRERVEARGSAREQNEEARERRRRSVRESTPPAAASVPPTASESDSVSQAQRTAAIENLFDTRR
jgi:hypothetical protein